MPRPSKSNDALYLQQVRMAAGFTQRQFAKVAEVGERTVQRWEAGRTKPSHGELTRIIRELAPRDRDLAIEVAKRARLNLAALGLAPEATAVTAPASPVVPAAEPPVRPGPTLLHLARVPLCAAAEVAAVSPMLVRPWLQAALASMRELGLSADDMLSGLSALPPEATSVAPALPLVP